MVFTLAFFCFAHEGLYDYDDYTYAYYANQLATGTFEWAPPLGNPENNPLHQRLLVFGPVALLYKLLGIGIFTTTLWPLLCTLGTSLIFYLLYRRRAPVVASAAMLLLGLHYFTLNLSVYLYPDNVLMFFAAASAAALLQGRRVEQKCPAWWGLGFAVLSFAALLSKETIVYYLPFYLGVFVFDMWQRRHLRFWEAFLGVGAILILAYLLFYQVVAHDAFYRIHAIEYANTARQVSNYSLDNALLARITYQPLLLLLGTGLASVLLPTLLALTRWRQLDTDGRFWLGLAGTALAFYWLGSTSFTYYNPNSLLPRMLTPLLPPLCLSAGVGVAYFARTGRGSWWLGLGLLVSGLWLRNSVGLIYGLLGGFFLLIPKLATVARRFNDFRPGTTVFAGLTLAVIGLLTVIRPAYFMQKPSNSGYFAQHRVLQRELRGPAGGVVLLDNFSRQKYAFFYAFHVPAGLQFRAYAAYDTLHRVPGRRIWLLINRPVFSNDELIPQVIPYSADQLLARFPRRQLQAQDNGVELYLLPE